MEEPRRLGGRYELGGVLGRGGMAEVYLAHDTRLGRSVAVKTLRADMARDPSFQARFRREAQSAASLNHPAIVAVYDTGEDYIDGISIPYIVMEYVEGSTLRELLHSGRRLLPERALEMTIGILQALEYSHRANIVHRDIKPANVMLTRQGNVKVMDFGIARAMGDAGMTMTQTSAVIGTAQYLSPEQAKGETVDARSDIYSTGCLLYELLTLRPPFVGDSPVAVAYQHVREEAMPPSSYDPEVRPEVDAIVLKALTKDREYRYQSSAEMRDDIERFLDGLPVVAAQQAAAYGMAGQGYGYEQQGYPGQHDPYGQTNLLPQQGAAGATAAMPQPGYQQPGYDGAGGNGGGYDDYNGGGGGGRRSEQPRKSNTSWVILAIAAVLVLVGAYFVVDAMTPKGDSDARNKVTVPNLVGLTLDEAKGKMNTAGSTGQVVAGQEVACPDAAVKKGQVCLQGQAANSQVAKDAQITVQLSSGPATADLADLTGKTQDAAKEAITKAGFTVGKITFENNDTVAQDKVIKQDPGPGKVAPGTAVNLTVSQGQSKVAVPNVTGQQQDAASQAITDAGLKPVVKTTVVTDQGQVGVVTAQTPKDTTVKPGSTVTLTVGKLADKVAVPILQGKTYKQAFAALQEKGLNIKVVFGPQDENAVVLYSEPPSGTQVDPGSTVGLTTRAGDKPSSSGSPSTGTGTGGLIP
ncbi:Stk1 family PASTA domain-containing Ser/Thr kinase [Kitasatospora sp. NPDC096147]|uniref:Stk1 family PASTA domain-containing Ser/Thr kinase n=1 Tax=Kitasatospora sp. NPDC096147 TaxID=3364093 RepID=UPI003807A839